MIQLNSSVDAIAFLLAGIGMHCAVQTTNCWLSTGIRLEDHRGATAVQRNDIHLLQQKRDGSNTSTSLVGCMKTTGNALQLGGQGSIRGPGLFRSCHCHCDQFGAYRSSCGNERNSPQGGTSLSPVYIVF